MYQSIHHKVCGIDRVTYSNPCELKTKATTRLDYLGACETNGTTVKAICDKVKSENRCQITEENCKSIQDPGDGCCPICGEMDGVYTWSHFILIPF